MAYRCVIAILLFCVCTSYAPRTVLADNGIPVKPLAFGQFITNWLVAGPLPNRITRKSETGELTRMGLFTDFLKPLGGETGATLQAGTIIPGFPTHPFTSIVSRTAVIDLNTLFNLPDQVCAYAVSTVKLDAPETVFLHAGSDDGIRVWVDDKLVIDKYVERGYIPDEDWVKLSLGKGRHRILVKSEDNLGAWNFSLRFLDQAQHRQNLAERVSDTLDVQLFCPTGEFQQTYLTFMPSPAITDFVVTINGRWLNDSRTETQDFSVVSGAQVQLPDKYYSLPFCSVEASATGIPGRQPSVALNIYLTATDILYSNRQEKINSILDALATNAVTAHIAGRHHGLLQYYLQSLAAVTNSSPCSELIEAHQILNTLDFLLKNLSDGNDYLGSLKGEYLTAYHSKLDGSGQPFYVTMPREYSSDIPLPLVLFLHDAGMPFSMDFKTTFSASPYIAARIHGRGPDCAYLGWSGLDVLEVINYMTNYYRVDSSRISLIGSSMGGYGVWTLASTYPGQFASVSALNSFSANNPLANVQNLPVHILHGDEDLIVPVSFSQAALAYLSSLTCPVVYNELAQAGYHLQAAADILKPVEWMLNYRRDPAPAAVHLEQMYSWNNGIYWLADVIPTSPRNTATIRGRFAGKNDLILHCENVRHAKILLPEKHVEKNSLLSITVNGRQFLVSAPLPEHVYLHSNTSGFSVARKEPSPPPGDRPYRKGSWQNLFNGEPLMIVKGTSGSEELTRAIDACADVLKKWSFPGRIMDTGGHPVKSDDELTDDDQAAYNLVLLGGVRENSIVDDIDGDLVFSLKKDQLVIAGQQVSLGGLGCWIVQKNPVQPKRLVWIWASSEPSFFSPSADWIKEWQFPAEDPPDVLVYDITTGTYVRAVHLTHNWKPEYDDIASPVLTNCIASPAGMTALCADTLCKATGCDAAWIPDSLNSEMQKLVHLRASEASRLIFKHSMLMVCSIPCNIINEMSRQKQKKPASIAGTIYPDPAGTNDAMLIRVAVLPHTLKSLATACRFSLTDVRYINAPLHELFTRNIFLKTNREQTSKTLQQ
jgi:hypothetical protein